MTDLQGWLLDVLIIFELVVMPPLLDLRRVREAAEAELETDRRPQCTVDRTHYGPRW